MNIVCSRQHSVELGTLRAPALFRRPKGDHIYMVISHNTDVDPTMIYCVNLHSGRVYPYYPDMPVILVKQVVPLKVEIVEDI